MFILLFTLLFNAIRKFHSPFTPYGTPFILCKLLPNRGIQYYLLCPTDSLANYVAWFLSPAFPRYFELSVLILPIDAHSTCCPC